MDKNLVIVESPAKSQTIAKYLGEDYTVVSSKGHIRDLVTRGYGGFGVDIENNFKPMYSTISGKTSLIKELKKLVKDASKVYLATDPDREGEAISWHLFDVLDLQNKPYERVVFHEITKNAVIKALENGREIDMDLVRSQESRRIVDRIIGFSLSKLLQKKIGSRSAGRVQSVALKLICDREKEIKAFIPEEYWEIYLEFVKKNKKLKAKLTSDQNGKISLVNESDTKLVLNQLGNEFKVSDILTKNRKKAPKPPYITSTLQQEAANLLGFSAKKTMMIAQKLYEGVELAQERVGLITYMRTDSIRLSNEFIIEAKDYIIKEFGKEYFHGHFENKIVGKNIQDAHEAIRPSSLKYHFEEIKNNLTNDEYKLYKLIYNRALASQMSDALIEDTKIKIANAGYVFELNGDKVLFEGYLKLDKDDDEVHQLPEFVIGESLHQTEISSEQKFTSPPLRYSEARLIKKMEELGIGRPSTYAMTVDTIKQRYYATLEKKVFVPTEQGMLTSEQLDKFFSDIINVKYTAGMEVILDLISEGSKVWHQELAKFYQQFMPLLDIANTKMEKIYPVFVDESCPLCGSQLVQRNGRFGRFLACSAFPKCRYIKKEAQDEPVNTGVVCPNCHEGFLVERISKKGKFRGQKFYACNRYPKCKTALTNLP
ncbi:MAG: type I DNA topoisomerase [Bacilli bacterium]